MEGFTLSWRISFWEKRINADKTQSIKLNSSNSEYGWMEAARALISSNRLKKRKNKGGGGKVRREGGKEWEEGMKGGK